MLLEHVKDARGWLYLAITPVWSDESLLTGIEHALPIYEVELPDFSATGRVRASV